MPIRVVIVEDHDGYREGLYHIINGTDGFRCVGSYDSAEEAVGKMVEADVVLLDIGLPGKSGIDAVPLIKRKFPAAQVIMLTVFSDDERIFRALVAGANGYLLKRIPPARLLSSIQEAVAGGLPMTPVIARRAIELFKEYVPKTQESVSLTPREKEILARLVDGKSYAAIAETLFISLDTVRNHIRHIYEKLRVHSKSQAVAKALRHNIR